MKRVGEVQLSGFSPEGFQRHTANLLCNTNYSQLLGLFDFRGHLKTYLCMTEALADCVKGTDCD